MSGKTSPKGPHSSAENMLSDDALDDLLFADINPTRTNSRAHESLAAAVGKAAGLKPFPVVAGKVLTLLHSPDFSLRELKDTIEQDPALATRILRVANSALFRTSVACNTIENAIIRLGANAVSELVAGIATMALFDDCSGLGSRFRDHCARVAALTRVLGASFRFQGVSQLFLCALLHDTGKLLTLQCGELDYGTLSADHLEAADRVHLLEQERLGYDHATLAAHVLDLWKIPYPVSPVVAFHHQPERAFEDGKEIGMMVALLRLADRLEYQLYRSEALNEAFLETVIDEGLGAFAGLGVEDLRPLWPGMVQACHEILTALR